jgi:hypothetical protein
VSVVTATFEAASQVYKFEEKIRRVFLFENSTKAEILSQLGQPELTCVTVGSRPLSDGQFLSKVAFSLDGRLETVRASSLIEMKVKVDNRSEVEVSVPAGGCDGDIVAALNARLDRSGADRIVYLRRGSRKIRSEMVKSVLQPLFSGDWSAPVEAGRLAPKVTVGETQHILDLPAGATVWDAVVAVREVTQNYQLCEVSMNSSVIELDLPLLSIIGRENVVMSAAGVPVELKFPSGSVIRYVRLPMSVKAVKRRVQLEFPLCRVEMIEQDGFQLAEDGLVRPSSSSRTQISIVTQARESRDSVAAAGRAVDPADYEVTVAGRGRGIVAMDTNSSHLSLADRNNAEGTAALSIAGGTATANVHLFSDFDEASVVSSAVNHERPIFADGTNARVEGLEAKPLSAAAEAIEKGFRGLFASTLAILLWLITNHAVFDPTRLDQWVLSNEAIVNSIRTMFEQGVCNQLVLVLLTCYSGRNAKAIAKLLRELLAELNKTWPIAIVYATSPNEGCEYYEDVTLFTRPMSLAPGIDRSLGGMAWRQWASSMLDPGAGFVVSVRRSCELNLGPVRQLDVELVGNEEVIMSWTNGDVLGSIPAHCALAPALMNWRNEAGRNVDDATGIAKPSDPQPELQSLTDAGDDSSAEAAPQKSWAAIDAERRLHTIFERCGQDPPPEGKVPLRDDLPQEWYAVFGQFLEPYVRSSCRLENWHMRLAYLFDRGVTLERVREAVTAVP